ncbi:MAG: DUF2156 domain-containing protein [Deltaproteobacteria bacterium]|nr:DUF2156 domain-containing protein [Deltaproteobacteria bacterium]
MNKLPLFPAFKRIALGDRDVIQRMLQPFQPGTSELTFTNLFMWQAHSRAQWSICMDCLVIVCRDEKGYYALPPVGPARQRKRAALTVLAWLRDEKAQALPRIERADVHLAEACEGKRDLTVAPVRDHFDYVYQSRHLIQLKGRKLHAKKNHINKFRRTYDYSYLELARRHVKACRDLADQWCRRHRCCENIGLTGEWEAIRRALNNFQHLPVRGSAVVVNGKIEAFTFGELLSSDTAVIHIEKANPDIPGLYAVINQQFCEQAWGEVSYVNREQDLGDAGLRKAKLSYNPDHFIEKFTITCL